MSKNVKEKKRLRSSLPVRLVLRGQDFELSTEGTITNVSKDLYAFQQLAHRLSAGREAGSILPPVGIVAAEFPSIKPAKSTSTNIESLFKTNWGKTPRNVAEVHRALDANAVPDTATNIAVYLNRLVKKGILRRVKKAGKWSYYKLPS